MKFKLSIVFGTGSKYECIFPSSIQAVDRLSELEAMGYVIKAWSVEKLEVVDAKAN